MNTAQDLRLFFSPIDRLFNTFTIPSALELHSIVVDEPVFVFGQGEGEIKGIDSTRSAIHHINIQPTGKFYLVPSKIDAEKLLQHCIENGHIDRSGQDLSFSSQNQNYTFTTLNINPNTTTSMNGPKL